MGRTNLGETQSELSDSTFAKHYPLIADTFMDTKGAAASLMARVSKETRIFEIGLGTGYFARFLVDAGYEVYGVEPYPAMLGELEKQKLPRIHVKAEQPIEEYEFGDHKYDVIISHSSVFLFTDIGGELVFQSMILNAALIPNILENGMRSNAPAIGTLETIKKDKVRTVVNVEKVMRALNDGGRFFINIQTNSKIKATVNDHVTWEMPKWQYDFSHGWVVKEFRFTHRGKIIPLDLDISYVWCLANFEQIMEEKGYLARTSSDGKWVVLTHASRP